jgi:hypothetical protein
MRARRATLLLWCLALFAACAGPPPGPPGHASVAVDVYGGLGGPPQAAPAPPKRVELVVDLTASMLESSGTGAPHVDAARAAAADLLYSLREGTEVAVRALGHVPSDRCERSERLAGPLVPPRREPLVERLADLAPAAEGSIAGALSEVRDDLVREGAAARTRVVLFTDLDGSCGGDLCAAAESLVETGAWLEVVTVGRSTPPACLAALRPSVAQPGAVSAGLPAVPPGFRVLRARSGAAQPALLGVGRAGEGAVDVAPGLVTVVVDLDPPEEVGPFEVGSGEFARIRLLEAYDAALPTRVWRVERGDEPVARAFPPAPSLPRRGGRAGP